MRAIRHFSTSSSFLIGLFFSFLVFASIAFVAYFLVLANDEVFVRESDAAITAELERLVYVEHAEGTDALIALLSARVQNDSHAFFYALSAPNGHRLIDSFTDGNQDAEMIAQSYSFTNGYRLSIGREIDDLEIAQWVGRTFGWLMILLLICISLVSFAIAYYVVSRINRIADTADRIIDTGNLSERLPVDNTWDDLSKLSIALNRMLGELEQQVVAIRTVSDNIAHDLRTPLTRIRSHIETMDSVPLRDRLLDEVDGLLRMFAALLRIAEVENTQQRSAFARHGLHQIIEDVVEFYAPLMESKEQHYTMHLAQITTFCDPDLMFQAVANVLDNAVKFTPVGGTIQLSLRVDNNTCVITISDSGPGIDQQDKDKITRRFFRAEESRTTPGFGLGMALVSAIMKIHDGQVSFSSQPNAAGAKGLQCELRLKYLPQG